MSRIRLANEISLPRRKVFLAQLAFPIFKGNPFDPRLRTHKIHKLSAQFGRTIYAVDIAGDLRATFYIEGEPV